MSLHKHPLQALDKYLPPDTFLPVANYLQQYKVHLTISRERKTILGNYRHAHSNRTHRISVNGNLNTFSFLITLLHELAHLLTFEKYGNRVQSHGREWKTLYGQLLAQFIQHKIFPKDVENELLATLHNPGASSCAEEGLMRVLRNYDAKKSNLVMVEEIPQDSLFKLKDGRIFKKGERLRKRYKCEEVSTGRYYLFSPVYEVEQRDNIPSANIPESSLSVIKSQVKPENAKSVGNLPSDSLFKLKDGRIFKKGEKLRTRYKCQEVATGKFYLFNAFHEVEQI